MVEGGAHDANEGFKAPADQVDQNWQRLAGHLARHGHELSLDLAPRQFAAGYGNLNYLVMMDGEPVVLRRPPPGPIPPGAHDMGREHRILRVLWRDFPLAPRSLFHCEDPAVLGAPFHIMEYRPGRLIGGHVPGDVAQRESVGRHLGPMMMALLARLHAVDAGALGLGDLGRPEGFLERQTRGWVKRAGLAWETEPPGLVGELEAWLARHRPPECTTPRLLHNDFKLDNIVLTPDDLAPVAVLDWDLCTRGDPLVDLGVTLSYWTETGDPPAMHALAQMPTAGHGFPGRREAVELYARAAGMEVPDLIWYRVFGQLRLAVVFRQLYRRYREGGTREPHYAGFGDLAEDLLDFAGEIARGRAF